ncbi:hypothetical protein CKAH01_09719 [Colletotrichum kahawae]|uniref:Uncharacterized protein n=1 Tax=Colletotrichum kahawae TaxID=34407 RepID=A0AAD9XZM9_COLKA|nr:hypothetical protein CKAH01_09719 [Colletotrichum kahawae]
MKASASSLFPTASLHTVFVFFTAVETKVRTTKSSEE